jgi:hypothetical protein
LTGYQDLSKLYPQLEAFFVGRLNVRKAVPSILIKEIARLVQKPKPRMKKIRSRLIEVGMILARTGIDEDSGAALDELGKLRFLPKNGVNGSHVLVGKKDYFAIPDQPRYATAFAKSGVLLDIAVEDVQIMDTMLRYMKLEQAYLSVMVTEESNYEDESYNDDLTQQLRAKAYALYWYVPSRIDHSTSFISYFLCSPQNSYCCHARVPLMGYLKDCKANLTQLRRKAQEHQSSSRGRRLVPEAMWRVCQHGNPSNPHCIEAGRPGSSVEGGE